jgi:hypothetical protein
VRSTGDLPGVSLRIEEESGFFVAKLVATPKRWSLSLYLRGPDNRYNGELLDFHETDVARLADDYERAFARYQELKQMALSGEYTEPVGQLTVRAGGPFDGVCLRGYHFPTRSTEAIARITACLNDLGPRGRFLVEAAKVLAPKEVAR